MSNFWDRVLECDHKNTSPDYYEYVPCPSPLCSGNEEHCLDCGVYIVECRCGYMNGMNGWPHKRWSAQQRKDAPA